MEGNEWDVPTHSAVQKGSGEEATDINSRRLEGGQRQGIQRLWAPPGDGNLLMIPGKGDIGGGRRLAGSGQELVPVKRCVEEDSKNPQQGGVRAEGFLLLF